MNVEIVYANEKYFESFHESLGAVARERVNIEMVEAPPLESVVSFQSGLIKKNAPVFYAVAGGRVVGWADISTCDNPRLNHVGHLGMGLLSEFRGQGLGSKLLDAALKHSKKFGLEKVALQVYTTNLPAIALYNKFGFEPEGISRRFRKLDGEYFDCLAMGKFL